MSEMMMSGGSTMPMPMSMMWMRMPGQTWLDVATSFLGMWTVMVAAMMSPSLAPMLIGYRRALGGIGDIRLNALSAVASIGYFFVWTGLGAFVFPLGAALAAMEIRQPTYARVAPIAAGVVVLMAASLQFSAWKARRLTWCREIREHGHTLTANAGAAWRHGLCLGVHCAESCAGLMTILLVLGVMDLRAMAAVTAVITLERVAPNGLRAARAVGAVGVGGGLCLIVLGITS